MSKAFIAGGWKTPSSARFSPDGIVFKRITRALACLDGTNFKAVASFAPPLSVTFPSTQATVFNSKPLILPVTANITVTPVGGVAPYTYLIERVSWTGNPATIANPNSASTQITKVMGPGDVIDIFRVTVTDALGSTAQGTGPIEFTNQPNNGFVS